MKKLHFDSPADFQLYFQGKNPELTGAITDAIREAMQFQKKTANLFEISFNDSDVFFEISLPRTQWIIALENCLKHYEEWEMGDDALDTYLLLKDVKAW